MAQASSDFPPAPPPKPTSAHASRTATPQHAISFAPPPPTEPYVPAELLNKSYARRSLTQPYSMQR